MAADGVDDEVGEDFLLARRPSCGPSGRCGATCCTNRLATCLPAGASVGSSVEGIEHLHDRRARPAVRARIEIGALQVVERRPDDDAASRDGPAPALPGRQVKSGSSQSATFMRNVPEPDLDADEARASSGSTASAGTRSRNSSFGGDVGGDRARRDVLARREHDARAPCRRSSAAARTRASVRIVRAARSRRSAPCACVMAPMPPSAWPQTPRLPFTSPKQWCSST